MSLGLDKHWASILKPEISEAHLKKLYTKPEWRQQKGAIAFLLDRPLDWGKFYDANIVTVPKDPLHVPVGSIIKTKAKRFKEALNRLIHELWTDFKKVKSKMGPNEDQVLVNIIYAIEGAD